MKCIEREMIALLDDAVTGFTTKGNVTIHGNVLPEECLPGFCRIVDISIIANYPLFPIEHPTIGLELYIDFSTLIGFIQQFDIKNLGDLEKITPARLLTFYHAGKASLYCCSDDKYLCFRKKQGILYASDYGINEREVSRCLATQDDFIEYTNLFG